MSLSFNVTAACLMVNQDTYDLINDTFDVFIRPDLSGEMILNTGGWDPTDWPLKELAHLVKETPEDLAGLYLVLSAV